MLQRRHSLIVSAIALALISGAASADPQAAQRAQERREKQEREAAQKSDVEPAAPRWPQATRKEPDAKATAKRSAELKAMFDAFNANDSAAVVATADKFLADDSANAYERAISARLAGASLLNADNARASAYLKRALELDGLGNNDHYESMYLLAQLQLQQQQYAESLATVDRFLAETKSQAPEELALKGNALYRLKRYPEAATVLKQALQTAPQPKPEWQQLLMQTYADMGQPAEASKVAEELAGKNPGDANAQINLAATYMQNGQDAKAVEVLETLRASGKLTTEQDYRNLYAMYSNAGDKWKEAVAVINEGLTKGILKPDHATYNALGQAYWFSEQTGPAIDAYRKAAPLAPDGETYLNLARALNNEGRATEAKDAAKQALAKGVKKPEDAKTILGGK